VLVEQHPDQQRERIAAEQLVGGVVLGDTELRHITKSARSRLREGRAPDAIRTALRIRQRWPPRRQDAVWIPPARGPPALSTPEEGGRCPMADLGFVLLTVAAFAVLMLLLRGADRL
jgi:hypothetical protein